MSAAQDPAPGPSPEGTFQRLIEDICLRPARAAAFAGEDLDGGEFSLQALRGRVVVCEC